MKPLCTIALVVTAGCGSLVAGTLTVSGDLQRATFAYDGNDVVLTAPASAVLEFAPENLAGFALENSSDPQQRRYRARFNRTPNPKLAEHRWIFSDQHAGAAELATASSSEPPPREPAATDVRPPAWVGDVKVQLPAESKLKDRKFSVDTGVPESPAAAVIGSAAALIRLHDASDATTQLLNFVDADGNLRSGFSFAVRPYRVFARPTLENYLYGPNPAEQKFEHGRLVRFLSRLDFSLAATVDEVEGRNKQGASVALGFSGYVFNHADSRYLLATRLVAAGVNAAAIPSPVQPDGQSGAVHAVEVPSAETKRITDEVFASVWNNSYWAFGGAPRWRSVTGDSGDFKYDGGTAWTTLVYGFEGAKDLGLHLLEDHSQLLLHTSFRDRQLITDPADATKQIREDLWISAAQLRIGGNNLNVFGECVWEKHSPPGRAKYSTRTYFVGVEKRLASDLWLQISLGSQEKKGDEDNSALIRTALNYAFGNSIAPSR